ncbi:MAG: hypothetical protein K2K85_01110 [Clostridia bacterium]|nr:hypothetical protein [Clostridia bacterium]
MKRYNIFFISIILICLLTVSALFCACSDKDNESDNTPEKDFEFKYYEFGARLVNYATIIKSVDDLSAFFNDESSPIYRKEDKYADIYNQKTLELFQDYDKKFFQNKSLVIIFRVRTCLGLESDIKDYEIIDNSLNVTITIIRESNYDYATAMTMHMCLLEFDKQKLSSVTQINVKEIEEII